MRASKLTEKKVCTRCKNEKVAKAFRVRVKNGNSYLNSTCKKCESELAMICHNKKKNDPEFKKKNAERSKKYVIEHSDEVRAKRKTYRQTPAYKKMMKEYRQRNKHKIYLQEIVTKSRYHEKNRDPITDKYVINILRTQGIRNPSPEVIEIKRSQILLARIKKKINKK